MKYPTPILLISLLILITAISSLDYHLDQTLTLSGISNLVKITALTDDALAVQSSSAQGSIITFLKGSTYGNKTSEFISEVDHSNIKATSKGVYVNDGSSLTQKSAARLNLTFTTPSDSQQYLSLGSKMILTSQYALAGLFDLTAISLKKLTLSTMQIQQITYGPFNDTRTYAATILNDLTNGDIAFVKGFYLFILDNSTLAIKQAITELNNIDFIEKFTSFNDPTTSQAIILFGRNRDNYDNLLYSTWSKGLDGNYNQISSFYADKSLQGPLFSTSLKTAVSISGYQASYWNTLSVLHSSLNGNDSLKDSFPVAVGYNETYFITRDNDGFYSYYQVGSDYTIAYRKSLFVRNDSHLNARTTNDDKFLFVSTVANQTYNIHKIDMQTFVVVNTTAPKFSFLPGSTTQNIDFYLFDSQMDRVMIVSVVNSSKYYLSLCSVSSETVIDQILIDFTYTVQGIRLFGNPQWGDVFAVEAQVEKDLMLYTYNITGDKISFMSEAIGKLDFVIMECSNYIVIDKTSTIKIVNIPDFSTVTQITITSFPTHTIQTNRNILIISDPIGSKNIVLDLDVSISTSRGSFYVHGNSLSINYNFAIFPKRGFYYQVPKNYSAALISCLIYDISNPALSSTITFESTTLQMDNPIYHLSTAANGSQCNMIFYVQYSSGPSKFNPRLVRYLQCTAQLQKQSIQTAQEVYSSSVFISRDQQYVIIGVQFTHNKYFLVQVRPKTNLSAIIFRQNTTTARYIALLNIFDVDITPQGQLIIQTPFTITVLGLQPQSFSQTFGLSSISIFDVGNTRSAYAGPSVSNPNYTTVVVRDQTYDQVAFKQILPNTTLIGISISPQGTYVAVITSNSFVYAWRVSSQTTVFFKEEPGVNKIVFTEENKLLLQFPNSFQVFTFNTTSVQAQAPYTPPVYSLTSTYNVQVSNSGGLIAEVTDDVITISKNTGEVVATFTAPITSTESVVSVSFSPSNNLIIATDAGSIFVLQPSGCSQTSASINLVCKQCEFPCKYCSGSTTSCTEYSALFFVLVIGGPLLFLIVLVVIIICVRKRKGKASHSSENLSSPLKNDTLQ